MSFKLPLGEGNTPAPVLAWANGTTVPVGTSTASEALPAGSVIFTLHAVDVATYWKLGDSSVVVTTSDDGFDGYIPAGGTVDIVSRANDTHIATISGSTGSLIMSARV